MNDIRQPIYSRPVPSTVVGVIRDNPHVVNAMLALLRDRREYLTQIEDSDGSFSDTAPLQTHVRFLKGMRADCADLIATLTNIINPPPKG